MRRFHSYGPADCDRHFCVPRRELVDACLSHIVDDPEKGMITLETLEAEAPLFEDRLAVVRDRNGLLLLEGRIRRGRLARRLEKLNEIDLNTWTGIN